MASAIWSQAAIDDLDEIYLYIARKAGRPIVAKQVDEAIRRDCDEYATLMSQGRHQLGTERSDLGPHIRCFTHQRWVIIFRAIPKSIHV